MAIRATLDSNILIYAELEPETEKGGRAQAVIAQTAPHGVLAVQALLEFLAVVRRRRIASLASAIAKVEAWSQVFETAPTTSVVANAAAALVRAHGLQVWDAVIWSAARAAGADLFLSENLQDGLAIDGMRVANPLVLGGADLTALLAG
ncbi:MAG TPA: PIN domain-containing protein [Caulobacteraceae bacterium]